MVLDRQNTTLPIRIAQLNTQRKKTVITQLLNNFGKDYDIFILQEPNWSLIGRDHTNGKEIYGPVTLQGWKTILPVMATAGNKQRPKTLTTGWIRRERRWRSDGKELRTAGEGKKGHK